MSRIVRSGIHTGCRLAARGEAVLAWEWLVGRSGNRVMRLGMSRIGPARTLLPAETRATRRVFQRLVAIGVFSAFWGRSTSGIVAQRTQSDRISRGRSVLAAASSWLQRSSERGAFLVAASEAPPKCAAHLGHHVQGETCQQSIESGIFPGPEVWGMEHDSQGNMTTQTKADGEDDPFTNHRVTVGLSQTTLFGRGQPRIFLRLLSSR